MGNLGKKITFLSCIFLTCNLFSLEITLEEAEIIGQKIYQNECSGKSDKLIWWNAGEEFSSLGIGHFIWYPEGNKGPFEETFPSLCAYFVEKGVTLPKWLKATTSCPWRTRNAFLENSQDPKMQELKALLTQTIPLQAQFIARRFELTLATCTDKQKQFVNALGKSQEGKYALLDYVNFKGMGTSEKERYKNKGWGLLQILEEMPQHSENPLLSFTETAKVVLQRRVKNSPPERNEERWLPGWIARIDTYRN